MTDRPIIFSGPMVRALMDGRKTQTRRVIAQPDMDGGERWVKYPDGWILAVNDDDEWRARVSYAPGDRLWVREAWRSASCYDDLAPSAMGGDEPVRYEADASWQTWGWGASLRWHGRYRHAQFMPRWASRLTLTVTEVRVQRLQDISEEDAKAEGAPAVGAELCPPDCEDIRSHVWGFHDLWNSLHGPDAWAANPWVAALTFTVQRDNIDQIGGAA